MTVEHRPVLTRPRDWSRKEKVGFVGLLVLAAFVYFFNLTVSKYGNEFYAAAEWAGSQSWKAMLFGSSDSGNSITVDKPPASLWASALMIRAFGLSSFTVLAPQAAMGVGTIASLYCIIRRRFSAFAAWAGSIVLLTVPVAVMMFRFNNPDALLILLLTLATGAVLRAIEEGRSRWMVLAGVAIGFAFLTKQMQAFLVLPGFALVWFWAAPVSWKRRIRDGLLAIVAMIVSGGWWVALVELWPASSRPYVGGSTDNSFLNLTFAYNGLDRITGGGSGNNNIGGATGLLRLWKGTYANQVSWLAPAAIVLTVLALILIGRARRTDGRRAQVVVWFSWLAITWLVFSFMSGTFHQYYTVALTPAIAALVGIGVGLAKENARKAWVLFTLAGTTVVTTAWGAFLLSTATNWLAWLKWAVVALGALGAIGLTVAGSLRYGKDEADPGTKRGRLITRAAATLAIVAALLGPVAWSANTIDSAHTGSIPIAGPTTSNGDGTGGGPGGSQGGQGGPGGQPDGAQGSDRSGSTESGASGSATPSAGSTSSSSSSDSTESGSTEAGADGMGQPPSGTDGEAPEGGAGEAPEGGDNQPPSGEAPEGMTGEAPSGSGSSDGQSGSAGSGSTESGSGSSDSESGSTESDGQAGGGNNVGAMLGMGNSTSSTLVKMLQEDSSQYRWTAAITASQSAASYELASETSVMPIGGFSGTDDSPTLVQFEKWVEEGEIHYYIVSDAGQGGLSGSGESSASEIEIWVKQNFTAQTVDGVTVYDLTSSASS